MKLIHIVYYMGNYTYIIDYTIKGEVYSFRVGTPLEKLYDFLEVNNINKITKIN